MALATNTNFINKNEVSKFSLYLPLYNKQNFCFIIIFISVIMTNDKTIFTRSVTEIYLIIVNIYVYMNMYIYTHIYLII